MSLARVCRTAQRTLTLLIAIGFIAGGISMPLSAPAERPADGSSHHTSHGGPMDHRGPQHQPSDCCDLCALHCNSQIGPARLEVPAQPPLILFACGPTPAPHDRPAQPLPHRHPPSQGPPPTLL